MDQEIDTLISQINIEIELVEDGINRRKYLRDRLEELLLKFIDNRDVTEAFMHGIDEYYI